MCHDYTNFQIPNKFHGSLESLQHQRLLSERQVLWSKLLQMLHNHTNSLHNQDSATAMYFCMEFRSSRSVEGSHLPDGQQPPQIVAPYAQPVNSMDWRCGKNTLTTPSCTTCWPSWQRKLQKSLGPASPCYSRHVRRMPLPPALNPKP